MKLAFRTQRLRRICESQACAEQELGLAVATLLRARLADVTAAETVDDLIAILLNKRKDEVIQMQLGSKACIRLRANHNPMPLLPDGAIDWSRVSRLQVLEVGVQYG